MVKINDRGHFIYNDEKYKMLYIYFKSNKTFIYEHDERSHKYLIYMYKVTTYNSKITIFQNLSYSI